MSYTRLPMTTPVGVLLPRPLRDTLEVMSLEVRCRGDQELEGASNTKFRHVRATESVIPYILCVVCIALGVDQGDLVWRGSLPALI
jgi:hypothetical protein